MKRQRVLVVVLSAGAVAAAVPVFGERVPTAIGMVIRQQSSSEGVFAPRQNCLIVTSGSRCTIDIRIIRPDGSR
jgi:hypothetical protein